MAISRDGSIFVLKTGSSRAPCLSWEKQVVRLLDKFYRTLLYLGAVSMVVTLVAIMLGPIGRQIGFDIPGLDAYAGYSIAASLFLSMPAALRNGDHIRVTLFLDRMKGTTRKIFDYWCLMAASGVSAYFAYFAVRLVMISFETHDVSPASDASPLWIPQLTMAIGAIGLFIAFIEELIVKIFAVEREALVDNGEMLSAE